MRQGLDEDKAQPDNAGLSCMTAPVMSRICYLATSTGLHSVLATTSLPQSMQHTVHGPYLLCSTVQKPASSASVKHAGTATSASVPPLVPRFPPKRTHCHPDATPSRPPLVPSPSSLPLLTVLSAPTPHPLTACSVPYHCPAPTSPPHDLLARLPPPPPPRGQGLRGSPLAGQLIQAADVAHHGHHQRRSKPGRHEHGQPQVAHHIHHATAGQLLCAQVQGVNLVKLHLPLHSFHIGDQQLAQAVDGIDQIQHLVPQCVRACQTLHTHTYMLSD